MRLSSVDQLNLDSGAIARGKVFAVGRDNRVLDRIIVGIGRQLPDVQLLRWRSQAASHPNAGTDHERGDKDQGGRNHRNSRYATLLGSSYASGNRLCRNNRFQIAITGRQFRYVRDKTVTALGNRLDV